MFKNIDKIKELFGFYEIRSLWFEYKLKLEYIFEKYNLVNLLLTNEHNIIPHLWWVMKNAGVFYDEYNTIINEKEKTILKLWCLLHDLGRLIDNRDFSNHDSINLEVILRRYWLSDVAQIIRHNPYLMIYDFNNGNLVKNQLLLSYSDARTDRNWDLITISERIATMKESKKKINYDFQESYYNLIEKLYHNKAIKVQNAKQNCIFLDRCDWRYSINKDEEKLDTLSSYHIWKSLHSFWYDVTVCSDNNDEFTAEWVKFIWIWNYDLWAYAIASNYNLAIITWRTSIFDLLKHSNKTLPMIVMRSLKKVSIDGKRISLLINDINRVIFVSKDSKEYFREIAKEHNSSWMFTIQISFPIDLINQNFFFKKKK